MSHKPIGAQTLLGLILVITLIGGACRLFGPSGEQPASPEKPAEETAPPVAPASPAAPGETRPAVTPSQTEGIELDLSFAKFNEPEVTTVPTIQFEPVAPDLKGVYNPFMLSRTQLERLAQDGFVVTPGSEKEFFTVYEKARYNNVPIFVTSDSLLHSYHLLFDKILRSAETQHFIPLLEELNATLLAQADEQYQALKDTSWEEPARRTVAFIAVASRLLNPDAAIPPYAEDLAQQELALIEQAGGIAPSPLFPHLDFGEDYTQYIPRGHYTRSEELKAYFKSMMWYGRMTFRLKTKDPEAGRAETRSGLLLVHALRNSQVDGRPALEAWAELYSPTVFFVGRSDDLTALQYLPVIDAVYGPGASLEALADDAKLDTFIEAANQLPPPRILGMVISETDDVEEETKGLRFMGQRFVPDAYIFRQLIYRNVGTSENRRGLPKGLDLMAAMGSERAYQILEESGDTAYENYPQQMEKVRTWLAGLSVEEWTETLYNAWIYSFYPLLEQPGEGYPAFMRTQAWLDKQLNTSLGSWAELKHDTILYAKQVYAEMGGGPPAPEPVPPKGYVEPVPQFYARLAALTAMTREGLESRGLLNEVDKANLERLEELARSFLTMAEKELRAEPLSEEEYNQILFFGGELEHLVMAAADSDAEDPFAQKYMDEEPQAAVIADVATDPDPNGDGSANPVVLEEAVGRINEIHVIVPLVQEDGTLFLQVAKGGVFAYYEFPWPAEDRLTDEKWRNMLDEGQAPPLPEWTASFMTEQGGYSEIQQAILSFQDNLTSFFWDVGYMDTDLFAGANVPFEAELSALRANKQYEGRQLVRSHFASYDLQTDSLAVVTTRETWDDKRYAGEFPEYDAQPIAHRGPYSVLVNYTLELVTEADQSYWKVSRMEYVEPPPDWETDG